jgi:hydroxyacylglutathione hydrolase
MLKITPVAAFHDNYIWLIRDSDTRHVAIVDPGDAGPVLAAIDADRLQPCAVLVTHHHGDHVGGIEGLLRHWNMPVFGPAGEDIPFRSKALRDGDSVDIAPLAARFSVLAIPGHTRGHIAYHGHGVLFAGDTLFMAGCGRLFEGTAAQMLASLDRIASLPDTTRIYCAHEYTLSNLRFARTVEPGNAALAARQRHCTALREAGRPTVPATLAEEKETNPFLRVRVHAVRAAAARHAAQALNDDVSVFAAVRGWKDQF